jgi:prephenate dehydrogenase
MIGTVAIAGVGLIGGSFALGLREAGFQGKILGASSARTVEAALALRVIDEGCSLEDAVAAADLVYLAHPISRILDALPRVAEAARPGTLVTDAGSTKTAIVARASQVFRRGAMFLGGHPMAGKAERGVEAADAGLFQGAMYVLTPESGVLPGGAAVGEFCAWVERLGSKLVVLTPEAHDRIVAHTSHLPQLASTALAALLAEQTAGPDERRISGGGLRDMTRLALSAYDLWRDICLTNAANIDRALSLYIQKLEHLRQNLRERELQHEFEQAAKLAAEVRRTDDATTVESG